MTSPITTHVLDLPLGKPAAGIAVVLEGERDGTWHVLGRGATDQDGRIRNLLKPGKVARGAYRLTFDVGAYFKNQGVATFYARVPLEFVIDAEEQHFHVPLLLSPFGYSTYRGS